MVIFEHNKQRLKTDPRLDTRWVTKKEFQQYRMQKSKSASALPFNKKKYRIINIEENIEIAKAEGRQEIEEDWYTIINLEQDKKLKQAEKENEAELNKEADKLKEIQLEQEENKDANKDPNKEKTEKDKDKEKKNIQFKIKLPKRKSRDTSHIDDVFHDLKTRKEKSGTFSQTAPIISSHAENSVHQEDSGEFVVSNKFKQEIFEDSSALPLQVLEDAMGELRRFREMRTVHFGFFQRDSAYIRVTILTLLSATSVFICGFALGFSVAVLLMAVIVVVTLPVKQEIHYKRPVVLTSVPQNRTIASKVHRFSVSTTAAALHSFKKPKKKVEQTDFADSLQEYPVSASFSNSVSHFNSRWHQVKECLQFLRDMASHRSVDTLIVVNEIFPVIVPLLLQFDRIFPNLAPVLRENPGFDLMPLVPYVRSVFCPSLEEEVLPLLPPLSRNILMVNKYIDHLVVNDVLEKVLPYAVQLSPYADDIFNNLPNLVPHFDQLLKYIPQVIDNIWYLGPHIPFLCERIDMLIPFVDELVIYINEIAPHADALIPHFDGLIILLDRIWPKRAVLLPLILKHLGNLPEILTNIEILFPTDAVAKTADEHLEILIKVLTANSPISELFNQIKQII